jgi:hypothetical protein
VEETGVPGENHQPVASHWQTLSQDSQDFIDNTQTHKCVTWGHNIYTVLHGEMIIYYQKH